MVLVWSVAASRGAWRVARERWGCLSFPARRYTGTTVQKASYGRHCWSTIKQTPCHNRILRWAGHVARMPMSRAPRQLLTCWVSHSRQIGCPQMTSGRTLENALKSKGISKDFDEWIAIAKDRSKWRQLTHSIPEPPDAWRLKGTSRENDYNCVTQ